MRNIHHSSSEKKNFIFQMSNNLITLLAAIHYTEKCTLIYQVVESTRYVCNFKTMLEVDFLF